MKLNFERHALAAADKALVPTATNHGVRVSNRRVTNDGQISYRVWGDNIDVAQLNKIANAMGLRQEEPLRWHQSRHGRGSLCAADALWTRNLGMGQSVKLQVAVLYSGSIVLRLFN